MKGKGKRLSKGLALLMAIVLLLSGITACSSSNDDGDTSAAAKQMAAVPAEGGAMMDQNALSVTSEDLSYSEAASEAEAPQASSGTTDSSSAFGGGIGPIADANAGFDRKVIYRANLVMKVEEFKSAEAELLDLIHLGGAYVLQFSDSRNTDEIGASYVIKVPSEGFSPFLEKLQKIENLKFEREVAGDDVTEEFVDLDARLKARQVVETRLLAFMDKATKSDDLVRFSNELARVQEEIEQIKGRIRYLDQNVAFSTINLRLYQGTGIVEVLKEEKKESFGDRISDALTGSAKALRQFGEGLLVAIAAVLPVLIVVVVIGVPIYYVVNKRRISRRNASEELRKAWNKPNDPTSAPVTKADDMEIELLQPESQSEPNGPNGQDPKDGGR
ncbi:DUF4349 domain-containing protein [Cohnella lupini]|uniref:Uncharacterized protein DUF4349 n=1 Tax=Cohnella lupini TaxID=1294267 RepID=A0A3D9IW98_9BACL|nr:DUF4349 domain-containing protein [Cohnella lupini]RED65769.1 uncharacterized protein DUF4349 [Cohnella lupini]